MPNAEFNAIWGLVMTVCLKLGVIDGFPEGLLCFTGSLIARWFCVCATLGTENFIRVNKPSREAVEFMSAIRVRALERMKQLVEKTEHDLLPVRPFYSMTIAARRLRLPTPRVRLRKLR